MKLILLPTFSDDRGDLTVLEDQIPFAVKRVFWITNSNSIRGGHRHIETQQALCCISGKCTVQIDDGILTSVETLDSPTKVLLLEPHEWHTMKNHDTSTVLLILASHPYDKADYIHEPYN
jgi:dTDP-4-dehydrorhamnose 3,5-epimerase-like enzyme